MHFLLMTIAFSINLVQPWPRWEERTIDCTSRPDECKLLGSSRYSNKYRCRNESMPHESWNELARGSTQRIACPLNCESTPRLSVLVKRPGQNRLCQKYYTYGKYRDERRGDWFLWLTEPCIANITTWCQFDDI